MWHMIQPAIKQSQNQNLALQKYDFRDWTKLAPRYPYKAEVNQTISSHSSIAQVLQFPVQIKLA